MKKISCSVVVPVFNPDLKVFEVMLGSLVKQTYQSFEVILVDDSDKIDVTKIVEKFPNLSIKHIKNSQKLGLTKSLNYGISLSRQEFIARADCDDFYREDRLEKQISFLKENSMYDLCGTSCVTVDLQGNHTHKRIIPNSNTEIKRQLHFWVPIVHSSVMFRNSFFKKYGTYSENYDCEDYELWFRAKKLGCKFHNLKQELTFLRIDRTSEDSRGRYWRQMLELKIKYFDFSFLFTSVSGILFRFLMSYLPLDFSSFIYNILSKYR